MIQLKSFTELFEKLISSVFLTWGKNRILNILFVVCLCYFFSGVFPFAPYEEDSLGIIMGSKSIIETGVFSSHEFSYGFQTQPGTYFWVVFLNKITGFTLLSCYSILSALFGICFLFLSVIFLRRITLLPFSVCGLILFLFQETYSSWYYCNSSVIAGSFMLVAFNILLRRKSGFYLVLASIILGIAAWSRADVLLFYPVSLLLLNVNNWKERIIKTSVLAILTIAFMSLLYWLSNLSVLGLISNLYLTEKTFTLAYNSKTTLGPIWSAATRSYLGFFSILLLFLISTGTVLMIKNKQWLRLSILLIPLSIFLIVLKGNITSSKHLLYFIPFFSIPVLNNFQYFEGFSKKRKKYFLAAIISLFTIQYILGLQIFFNSHPYIGKKYATVNPYPTYLEFGSCNVNISYVDSIKFVIGGGMKLATGDEMMLSSGIIFSPIMWHDLKNRCNEDINGLENFINSHSKDSLKIFTTQGSIVHVTYILNKLNYSIISSSEKLNVWGRKNKSIRVYYAYYPKEIKEYTQLVLSNDLKGSIFIPYWDWEKYFVSNGDLNYTRINDIAYIIKQ